jgi:hypothetical protein
MITLDDVLNMGGATVADRLRARALVWRFRDPPGYDEWADLVEEAVYNELQYMVENRHSLQKTTEDGLTVGLVRGLDNIGLNAVRRVVGGNCDVVVSLGQYNWIGEAKINTGVSKVWGGYLQLVSRYADGIRNNHRGGMLMYCLDVEAAPALQEWRVLLGQEVSDSNIQDGPYPLTFRSTATLDVSGRPYSICHFAFPLKYTPLEGIVVPKKESYTAGAAAKKQAAREFRDSPPVSAKDGSDSGITDA